MKLGSLAVANDLNSNFVVCSPSLNTDDDCQYTNSSALKSVLSSALKSTPHNAKLIYTDDKKEEDLSSQAIDEQDKLQQFTVDEEDEEESKQMAITGDHNERLKTPQQNHVEILDTDVKKRVINDTPQVMEMIDSSQKNGDD